MSRQYKALVFCPTMLGGIAALDKPANWQQVADNRPEDGDCMGRIWTERDGRGVVTVWLDNPGRLNALSNAMVAGLCEAFAELAIDDLARAVVLRGRGGVFCAGRDLNDLLALQSATKSQIAGMYDQMEAMNRAVLDCDLPVIAVVEGHALGIATMIVSWADIALGTKAAKLGYPEVRYGIVPYGAVPTMLRCMPQKAVMELLLSGRRIDGDEAVRLGILSFAVPGETIDDRLEALVSDVLSGDRAAQIGVKRFARHCQTLTYDASISAATRHAKVGTGRGAPAGAGMAAFLGRKE